MKVMRIPLKSRTANICFVVGGVSSGGGCSGGDDDLGVGGSGGGAKLQSVRVLHTKSRIWSIRQGSLNACFVSE